MEVCFDNFQKWHQRSTNGPFGVSWKRAIVAKRIDDGVRMTTAEEKWESGDEESLQQEREKERS